MARDVLRGNPGASFADLLQAAPGSCISFAFTRSTVSRIEVGDSKSTNGSCMDGINGAQRACSDRKLTHFRFCGQIRETKCTFRK